MVITGEEYERTYLGLWFSLSFGFSKLYGGVMDIQKENANFGDYCSIEQKRYGVSNEFYGYKVVNRLRSNSWIDVPVDARNSRPNRHDEIADIVEVISCTVGCDVVERFRISDLTRVWPAKASAVPEGFVLVSHKDLLDLTVAINAVDLATHTDSKTNEVREIWQTIAIKLSSLGEAQEQK